MLHGERDALGARTRPWFAGTVEYVSVQLDRHQLRPLHEAFEDGTPNFLDIAALDSGFALHDWVGVDRLTTHVEGLATALIDAFRELRLGDGSPVVRMNGVPQLDAAASAPGRDCLLQRHRSAGITDTVLDRGTARE